MKDEVIAMHARHLYFGDLAEEQWEFFLMSLGGEAAAKLAKAAVKLRPLLRKQAGGEGL